jgi:hypothetical protein
MSKLAIFLLILIVFTGCGEKRMSWVVNPGAQIKVVMSGEVPDIYLGLWDAQNLTIYINTRDYSQYTLAHELCHAADTVGSFDKAFDMIGYIDPKYNISDQVAVARKVKSESLKYNGKYAHWMALYKLHGAWAVRHREIMEVLTK